MPVQAETKYLNFIFHEFLRDRKVIFVHLKKYVSSLAIAVTVALGTSTVYGANDKAMGIKLGEFTLLPDVSLKVEHDTNIYANSGVFDSDTNNTNAVISDTIIHLIPKISLKSNWKKHALNFSVNGDIARYQDNSGEDYEDLNLNVDGKFDLSKHAKITAQVGRSYAHTPRGSIDDTGTIDLEEKALSTARLGFESKPGSVGFKLSVDIEDENYYGDSVKDRVISRAIAELGYDLAKDMEAFGRISIDSREYDEIDGSFGVPRDSNGYVAVVGVRYKSGRLNGEAFAGWMEQDYDYAGVADVDGLAISGSISYDVSKKTKFKAKLSRDNITETTGLFAANISTALGFTIEHKLDKNFTVMGGLKFTDTDSRNSFVQNVGDTAVEKNEDRVSLNLSGKYDFSRNVYASAGFSLDETYGETDFTDNFRKKVYIGIGIRM